MRAKRQPVWYSRGGAQVTKVEISENTTLAHNKSWGKFLLLNHGPHNKALEAYLLSPVHLPWWLCEAVCYVEIIQITGLIASQFTVDDHIEPCSVSYHLAKLVLRKQRLLLDFLSVWWIPKCISWPQIKLFAFQTNRFLAEDPKTVRPTIGATKKYTRSVKTELLHWLFMKFDCSCWNEHSSPQIQIVPDSAITLDCPHISTGNAARFCHESPTWKAFEKFLTRFNHASLESGLIQTLQRFPIQTHQHRSDLDILIRSKG